MDDSEDTVEAQTQDEIVTREAVIVQNARARVPLLALARTLRHAANASSRVPLARWNADVSHGLSADAEARASYGSFQGLL